MSAYINPRIYSRRTLKNPSDLATVDPCHERDARRIRFLSVSGFGICRLVNTYGTKQTLGFRTADSMFNQ